MIETSFWQHDRQASACRDVTKRVNVKELDSTVLEILGDGSIDVGNVNDLAAAGK